tara:strand:- start:99 stop:446 length:348 start_codon:yes stop_codon:yes gene_type:complete
MAERIRKQREYTSTVRMDNEYKLDPKSPLDASLIGAQIRFNKHAESAQDIINAAEMTSGMKVRDANHSAPQTVYVEDVYVLTDGKDTIEVSLEAVAMFQADGWKLVTQKQRKIQQ